MSIIRYACHTERSNFVAESSVSLACPVQEEVAYVARRRG